MFLKIESRPETFTCARLSPNTHTIHFSHILTVMAPSRAPISIGKSVERSLSGDQDMEPEFREWLIDFGDTGYVVMYRFDGTTAVLLALRPQLDLERQRLIQLWPPAARRQRLDVAVFLALAGGDDLASQRAQALRSSGKPTVEGY